MPAIIAEEPTAEETAAEAAIEAERRSLDPPFPFKVEPFDPDFFS